jgi:uncharacterized protein (TIGR03083 family)
VRHPDWDEATGRARTGFDAFVKTAAELGEVIAGLEAAEWDLPVATAVGSVRDLVAHLVGVERYVLGQLGRRSALDAPRREDHYPVSRLATGDIGGVSDLACAQRWWAELMDVVDACASLGPQHPVTFHHLPGSVRGLLVVRTFELWTHGDDIRRATGRPLNLLDETRLALMSGELMSVLPLGMTMAERAAPGHTAEINLTGAGGGSYVVALAPGEVPGPISITITAPVLELCRLAANRLAISDLDAVVTGDGALLEPILVGATGFAAD